jgi:leucyl/phenylalanyl-tRNA--protein transferase
MPVFKLSRERIFPPVHLTSESGLLAFGGDLSPERLLSAYRQGIFPWYSDGDPILWWSPDPRFVLFLHDLRISRSMNKILKSNRFKITFDQDFLGVISACQKPRKTEKETWITTEMQEAYHTLHRMGFAHSAEAWHEDKLVGGIYGVSLGRCFFGESMFSVMSNASKAALIRLVQGLQALQFSFLDCQVYTGHMETLGAKLISREKFIRLLEEALENDTLQGNWENLREFSESF